MKAEVKLPQNATNSSEAADSTVTMFSNRDTVRTRGVASEQNRPSSTQSLEQAPKTSTEEEPPEDWSASRAQKYIDDKTLMAQYFAQHHFLVREDFFDPTQSASPEDERETVASILLNLGTTPNSVVMEVVQWIKENKSKGPFFLTWYTPAHVIPTTLKGFRDQHKSLQSALRLFLFPGEVDEEIQSVLGRDAVQFAKSIKRHFTYSLLSSYSFDVATGDVYFYFPRELELQEACAMRFADHKFLFLDPSKFKTAGERAFGIIDMLRTAYSVTIYTVSSERDEWIAKRFKALCDTLLDETLEGADTFEQKALRLLIVGRDQSRTKCEQKVGYLKQP